MPKPFFVARPSGLFVRFLIPSDLRATLQARFIVRRLFVHEPDRARLAAARMGAALSDAFDRLREGTMADFDLKGLLDNARRGELRDFTLRDSVAPDGTRTRQVEVSSDADLALYHQHLARTSAFMVPQEDAPPVVAATPPVPPATNALLLSEAIETYKMRRQVANLEGQTDVNNTLLIFSEMVPDKALELVDDGDVLAFESAIANWPANSRKMKRYRGMTSPEIVRDAQARLAQRDPDLWLISDHTRRKHRDTLAAFFNWAVEKKKISASPMEGDTRQPSHRVKRVQTRRPFDPTELELIFNPATFVPWTEGKPQYYWAPWIALYSGARLNEVAQLYVRDIQIFHKIPGFAIGASRDDQRVKTQSSWRFIPFAKALIDAGILDYVNDVRAAGHDRLFPHLKFGNDYGDYLGDRFIEYLKSIGLKAKGNKEANGMGFHWFRHNVGHAVVNTTTAINTAASITGHGAGNILPGELATYVQPTELRAKLKAVNMLKFPKPPKYQSGMFDLALANAHKVHARWAREAEAAAALKRADAAGGGKGKKTAD